MIARNDRIESEHDIADVAHRANQYHARRAYDQPARINGPHSPIGVILLVFAGIGIAAVLYYAPALIGALIGV